MDIKNDVKWLKERKFVTEIGTPSKLNNRNELTNYVTQVGVGVQLDHIALYAQYLTFEALEDGTFSFTNTGTPTGSVSYSLDNGTTWTALGAGSSTPTITAGSKVLWKGNYKGISYSDYGSFSSTGKFNVLGSVMSLAYEDDFKDKMDLTGADHIFCELFKECSNLIDASNLILPATVLADNCYNSMFYNCTSLTTTPELPATIIANGCYLSMFSGCSSLTTTPKLSATTLAWSCYESMFSGCTSLTTAPELPAMTLAGNCYKGMFQNCTSLTTTPGLPAMALAGNCYESMFSGCTSLTTAPELPATTLVDLCYGGMFYNCTSLTTSPKTLPATTLASNCYNSMFYNCSSLTTAPVLPATILVNGCYESMFSGCTSLTTAPELPATTLVSSCYLYMFYECSNLNHIKALFTTTPGRSYTADWVVGISSTGTFIKNTDATWNVTGNNGIPTGWTVETATA